MTMKTLQSLIFCFLSVAVSVCHAQTTEPGWYSVSSPPNIMLPLTSASTNSGYQPAGQQPVAPMQPSAPVAEAITPQIQALADGLGDNPTNIFNYVHDHINFVLYFGAKKGAELTLLEKSGNDFDQSALLVALLSAAGYSNDVSYQFGWMEIPYNNTSGNDYDLQHWLQLNLVNTNWTDTYTYLDYLFGTRGYPSFYATSDGNDVLIQRCWVQLQYNGNAYQLDPAFKPSVPVGTISGFSFTNAMGGAGTTLSNALWTAAAGTDTANYCSNLNEVAIRGQLTAYATNLLNNIQSNPATATASVQQMLNGWQILPANDTIDFNPYPLFLVYDLINGYSVPILNWKYAPTNLMSTLSISFAGTNYQWFMPQLQGDRISLTFSNNGVAQLWQDDTLLAQGATSGSGTTNVVLSAIHPIGSWDMTNNTFIPNPSDIVNMTVTNSYQCTNADYAIMYAFEPDWGWLQQRENKLAAYMQEGLTNGSRQVTCETLNIMGLNYLLQSEQVGNMLASPLNISQQNFHRIGRMAQESGNGYYVDIYMQFSGEFPNNGWSTSQYPEYNSCITLWSVFSSAMEHGLIEELQNSNLVGASTVKMLEVANTNKQPVYLASSGNWSTIQSQLTSGSYSAATISQISSNINAGYYILLPKNGTNTVSTVANGWAGYGYEGVQVVDGFVEGVEMKITGGYLGGYVNNPFAVPNSAYTDETEQNQFNAFTETTVYDPGTGDPVDTANGTFEVQSTDLSVGQAEPKGISLTRYYNGTRRLANTGGMTGGWIHNYCVTANNVPAPQAVLGGTTPQQATALLTATTAAITLYNGASPDAKNWLTTDLIAKWGIDQLTKSGVSVNLGNNILQFVEQPNGVFVPPANCTATLIQTNSAYQLQMRHGNILNFNASGYLTNIVDQYGNALNLTYNASNWVQTVTDWKNRQLTFNYSGTPEQLTSVSDGTRTVNYGYSTAYNSQGDLTSFTDAQGNTSAYQYDTNHDITATIDAQNRLVISNIYNTQGELTAQYAEGNTNRESLIYWSGYTTTEIDPAGDQQTYSYDNQGRPISTEDALGNLAQYIYDGQNHVVATISPLYEIKEYLYDANNNLTNYINGLVLTNALGLGFTNLYFYDSNNNLVKSIDPRGDTSTFGYNTKFSLTGQTNGAGNWTNYVYNANGTLASSANAGGTTSYGYDSLGQLSSIAYPGISTNTYANSYAGDVTNFTDGRGFATAYQYNALRQLTNTIAPTNVVTKLAYDPEGNQASMTDPRGNVTAQSWSATRKLFSTTLPAMSAGTPVTTNIYDNRDWLIGTFDPLKNESLFVNDPDERLVSQTDPVQRTTTFGYDGDSRNIVTTNGAGEVTSQTWDDRSELIDLIDGAGHTSIRGYDAAGNQIVLTNRNGYVWHFYFDGANRLTNTVSPLGHSTMVALNAQGLPVRVTDPMSQITTNAFDTKGRLTNRADSFATTLYRYDADDNLTSISENGLANNWTFDAYDHIANYQDVYGNLIQYRYDASGNLTNLVYPGGRNVYYSYDSNNHMTSVMDWSERVTTMTYDLNGRLTSITRPNGTSRIISYDSAGEVTNILEQMANGLPIALMRYNWDQAARMSLDFIAPLPHTNAPPLRSMTYNSDNELATFQGPTMGSPQSVTENADGNLTYGPLTNDTFATYMYDVRNRLTNAAGVVNVYDAANNRIAQTYGTNSVEYIVSPNAAVPQVLERIKNGVTTYYVYGPGLLYQITEAPTGTNTVTYHYDYRGSTIALTGDNGLATDRIEYSLYGTTTYRAGTNDTPFLFAGSYGVQSDPDGLLYMRARYYDPYLCRFLNADPKGFTAGLNFYVYANGNPANNVDPLGLQAAGSINGVTYNPFTGQPLPPPGSYPMPTYGYFLNGALLGGAVALGVTVAAPLTVSGLVALGVPATTASATVTFGLGTTAVIGGVATTVNTYNDAVAGNWNGVAFNVGTLTGGSIIGVSGGGQLLAEGISGQPTTASSGLFGDSALGYDPNYPNGSLFDLVWLWTNPAKRRCFRCAHVVWHWFVISTFWIQHSINIHRKINRAG